MLTNGSRSVYGEVAGIDILDTEGHNNFSNYCDKMPGRRISKENSFIGFTAPVYYGGEGVVELICQKSSSHLSRSGNR